VNNPSNPSNPAASEPLVAQAKVLARQLRQAAWNAGYADGCESERRQDVTSKREDDALLACLTAIDALATPVHQAAEPAPADKLRAEMQTLGYSDTAINAMGDSTTMMQRAIDARKMLMAAEPAPTLADTRHEINTHANNLRAYVDSLSGDAFQGAIHSLGALRDIIDGLLALAASPALRATGVPAGWTITAPDGWMLTGEKPMNLILEASRHAREIDPAEADRQDMRLMAAIDEEMAEHKRDRAELVNRFLRWPLPRTVYTDAGTGTVAPSQRPENWSASGTNLLTADEAHAMLAFVLDCDEGDRELAHRETYPPTPALPDEVARTDAERLDDDERAELERLRALVNSPETRDFLLGVRNEVAHQVERWGTVHARAKEPADWFWLIGYLGGKALAAHVKGDTDKAMHHCISTAAALANWHTHILHGAGLMQPGSSDLQDFLRDTFGANFIEYQSKHGASQEANHG